MKMNTIYRSTWKLLIAAISVVSAISCIDEPFQFSENDGEACTPNLIIEFEPSADALTRATGGEAIKEINSLSIVVYKSDETFYGVYNYGAGGFSSESIDRTTGNLPNDYSDYLGDLSESNTPKVELKLPMIPNGEYYMYAVANMGALTQAQVETPEKLKSIKVDWNTSDISSNNQMFGYFTAGTNGNSMGFEAPLVTINATNTQFHAWVKRCASKVTIVYDGSGLHNDIFVYIHKVTIRDIPKTCYLGQENTPKSEDELHSTGESIYYNSANVSSGDDDAPTQADYLKWMRIGKGSNLKGAVEADGTTTHSETATALYFYENVQGSYNEKVAAGDSHYDKRQIWENVGHNVYEDDEDYKDNILNGTYIEVEGYYVSKHAPGISQGAIKYRFMLGQDLIADYNAFRNRHYKLTLKFKGYANQADWHIEYIEETPEIYVPDEFYVSYLYNKQHTFPMRIVGECEDLEVEIIRNDWHPYDPTSTDEVPNETITNENEIFRWNRQVWENNGYETTGEIAPNKYNSNPNNRYYGRHKYTYTYNGATDTVVTSTPPHAGFLSLTVPRDYENYSTELPKLLLSTSGTHWYSSRAGERENGTVAPKDNGSATKGTNTMNGLRAYYYGTGGMGTETNNLPQNKRELDDLTPGDHDSGRNQYHVTSVSDGSKLIEFSLWTRPFSMIYISGFSGNNPYEAYQRKALLRIRGTFKVGNDRKVIMKTVPVYQVRRIINPKAVWRSETNNDSFHVQLMQRRNATTSDFETFRSEGPWRATITAATSPFCTLSGAPTDGASVVGDTDEIIDFNINFNGSTTAGHSNCAIITVMYHGYNCEHTIFVRQGYNEPLEIISGSDVKWSSYSLYAARGTFGMQYNSGTAVGIHTVSPLALGTFFKRGNFNDGMITSNNTTYGNHTPPYDGLFELKKATADGTGVESETSKSWKNINGMPYTTSGGSTTAGSTNPRYTWADIKIGNRIYSLPTMEQYIDLQNNADVGFGVLYGDGATNVATSYDGAFGYLDPDNNNTSGTEGMRGVVVYNEVNANQIFFPVGYTGIGRRTIQNANGTDEIGILRYGSQSDVLSVSSGVWNEHRPISYNLPNNAGAIYWAKDSNTAHNLAWDINFADLNFSPYDYGCAWGRYGLLEQGNSSVTSKGDALPIKLVYVRDL